MKYPLLLLLSLLLAFSCSRRDSIRGFYTGGWEWSRFVPCSSLEEQWWVTGNETFFGRYDSMITQKGYATHSGPYVYLEVHGTKSDTGSYGHLGAYEREFEVTEVLSMEIREGLQWGDKERLERICTQEQEI